MKKLAGFFSENIVVHAQVTSPPPGGMSNRGGEPDQGDGDNVEVRINGNGPSVRFSISMVLLLNLIIGVVTFGIIFAILRANVASLQEDVKILQRDSPIVQQQLIEVRTTLQYIKEDVVYVRSRIDGANREDSRADSRERKLRP